MADEAARPTTTDGIVQVPARARRGDVIEIKALARHPMESGFRVDDVGRAIPRHIVERFVARYGGQVVFEAQLFTGIATNPYIAFRLRVGDAGPIDCEWIDDRGGVITARAMLVVEPA